MSNEWPGRIKAGFALSAFAGIGLGLLAFAGGIAVKVSSAAKADRLERSGVAVTATTSDYRKGHRGHTSDLSVHYSYEGRSYRAWTECRPDELCAPSRGVATLELKVDPAQPSEFVTAAGSTDDSRNLLNSWKVMFLGLAVTVIGGALGYVLIYQMRWERRRRAAARPKH
nr:DUF3592 domain-containing protein [uncultured Actinoplanes sp.]